MGYFHRELSSIIVPPITIISQGKKTNDKKILDKITHWVLVRLRY